MAGGAKTQEKIADLSTVDGPGSTTALEAFGVKRNSSGKTGAEVDVRPSYRYCPFQIGDVGPACFL
jgi:hypothetical protein